MTHLDKHAVISNLSSSYKGLSENEAKNRLLKYGKNKLKEDNKTNILKMFVSQLINPLVIVLLSSFPIANVALTSSKLLHLSNLYIGIHN